MKNENICTRDIAGFRERIEQLRGSMSIKDFAKSIGVAPRTYENWTKASYTYIGKRDKVSYTLPKIEVAIKICDTYGVTLDWLFRGAECTDADNQRICNVIGLDDAGIDGLKSIKQSDDNYIFNKQPGLCVLPILNKLLGINHFGLGAFEIILRALRDYFNNDYVVPVHHVENKQASKKLGVSVSTTVQSDNNLDYIDGGSRRIYVQHFARTNDINDNISVPITQDFLQGVALKQLEQTLIEIRQDMTS